MTLRHLKIFIAVSDAGSMTRASKQLHISQPTVSQAVSELEIHYGIRLFERLSKKLYITEVGRHLLSYARHIAALFDEMDQVLKNPDASGLLRIGASVTIGTCLLPGWMRTFAKLYPNLQTRAVIKNTSEMEALLIRNELDFAVVEGEIHSQELTAVPFMADELALICGPLHPFFESGSLKLADLQGQAFIVREQGSGTRELFENAMSAQGILWKEVWDCSGSEGLKSAAACGLGIGVISRRLVEKELQAGELTELRVLGLSLQRDFSVVYHKNKFVTPAMAHFFHLCKGLTL